VIRRALGFCAPLALLLAWPADTTAAEAKPRAPKDSSSVEATPAPRAGDPPARPSSSRRALAIGAAVVPGFVAHGTGHYVLGDPRTGSRLLLAEGVGLGATAVGGVSLFLTGASRYLVAPLAALTIAGIGVFAISWFADIYGVAAGPEGTGVPLLLAPRLETELGYRYVYDPQFAYRSFFVSGFDLRLADFRLEPSAWTALDDANARFRLLSAWRIFGPRPAPAPRARDGSSLELQAAATHHRYDTDGFNTVTVELALDGRLDLERWAEPLRGSFADFGVGAALQAYDYDVPDLGLGSDVEQMLLARFGFGMYLGDPAERGGEVLAYYDHRHDDFAAGLKMTGLGSGIPGHFGAEARYYFSRDFGLLLDAQAGSAYVFGLSLLYRVGRLR
jgi:hypothetical protein